MAELILTDGDLKLLAEVGKTIREKGTSAGHAMLEQSESLKKAVEKFKNGFQDPAEFGSYGNACKLCSACAACGAWFPLALVVGVDGILGIVDVRPDRTVFGSAPRISSTVFDPDPPIITR